MRLFTSPRSRPMTRHPKPCRRPLVEDLEGRQLLSTFSAAEIKKTVVSASLSHTVAPFSAATNHSGATLTEMRGNSNTDNQGRDFAVAAIQGGHIGTGFAAVPDGKGSSSLALQSA